MRRVTVAAALGVAALAACGPIDPGLAADQCEARARQADGPFGEVEVGTVRGQAAGSFEVGITSDFLTGRDPYEVYDTCVRAKTGQGPVRPLLLPRA